MEFLLECIFWALGEIMFDDLGEWFLNIMHKKIAVKIQNRYLRWTVEGILFILAIVLTIAVILGIFMVLTLLVETFMH